MPRLLVGPTAEIIEFKRRQSFNGSPRSRGSRAKFGDASSGADGGGGSYTAGQTLLCRVLSKEPGGYSVLIVEDDIIGFLPTNFEVDIAVEIEAQLVCFHNNRALVSKRFSV